MEDGRKAAHRRPGLAPYTISGHRRHHTVRVFDLDRGLHRRPAACDIEFEGFGLRTARGGVDEVDGLQAVAYYDDGLIMWELGLGGGVKG